MDGLRRKREDHGGKGRGRDSNQIPTNLRVFPPWLREGPSD
jgi:hypothetical protein